VKPGRRYEAAGLTERLLERPLLRDRLGHRVHEQPVRVHVVLEPPPVAGKDVRPAVNDRARVPGIQFDPFLPLRLRVQPVRHAQLVECG
jgi:hypothetical protein